MNVVRGRTLVIKSQIFTDNGLTPAALAGASIRCTIKKNLTDTDAQAYLVKTNGAGIVVTDETKGLCETTISANELNLTSGYLRLYYEVTAKLAGGYFIGHVVEVLEFKDGVLKTPY